MARNYDIAEFRETDALDPTATRKLNANFRRILELVNGIQVEGVDTDAIAQFVVSVLGGDIRALQGIVYANDPSHESRITALEALPPGAAGVSKIRGKVEASDVWHTGDVELQLTQIEIPMDDVEILTEWDQIINPTQGEQNG